jgi:hypothetical protein
MTIYKTGSVKSLTNGHRFMRCPFSQRLILNMSNNITFYEDDMSRDAIWCLVPTYPCCAVVASSLLAWRTSLQPTILNTLTCLRPFLFELSVTLICQIYIQVCICKGRTHTVYPKIDFYTPNGNFNLLLLQYSIYILEKEVTR